MKRERQSEIMTDLLVLAVLKKPSRWLRLTDGERAVKAAKKPTKKGEGM